MICNACNRLIEQEKTGETYLPYKDIVLCDGCYVGIIPKIYEMAGYGDGGIIHAHFDVCLSSQHNKKKRTPLLNYRKIFEKLLYRYKFSCVHCETKENLTIDHIHPVSKGGGDEISNLQILCHSCNARKGAKLEVV